MKKKDLNDLRNKNVEQLVKLIDKKSVEIIQIKAKLKVSKEKNLKRVKNLKKEVAQIKTILKEKELVKTESSERGEGRK